MNGTAVGASAACIVFVLSAVSLSAQTTASGARLQPATVEQQVLAAQQQFLEATRASDKDTARRLMAEDMTWIMPDGRVMGREDLFSTLPTPPREVSVTQVREMGEDTAVLTGSAGFADGRQVRFLQEWVKRGGEWRLFAHQGTLLPPAAAGEPAAQPVATAGRVSMRSTPPSLNSDEERAIWKVQTALYEAFMKGDAASYARFTAADYFRVETTGDERGRTEFLEAVKVNAGKGGGSLDTADVRVSVTGNTARVVLAQWGALPSGEVEPPTRVTRVFVKRDGRWQQAAAIFTPVAQ